MNWITLTIASAMLLGIYDFFKKRSVKENAVPVVLLASVCVGALPWLLLMLCSEWGLVARLPDLLRVRPLSLEQHVLVLAKSVLVGASWTLAFIGLKHLPLSIAGPIRSTSPLWTILIAVGLLGERPTPVQWIGVATILVSFLAFSLVGRREGIHFHKDRWVFCMIGATLLGSLSSLYDKYLLQSVRIDVPTLQAWFSIYLVPVMMPLAIRWRVRDRQRIPFEWRWTIPCIAVTLLVTDFAYFLALSDPVAKVSLVSPIRRTSVVIPFLIGVAFYGEQGFKAKAACVCGLLVGVFVIALAK